MKVKRSKDIGRIFAEGTLIDSALVQAAREVLRRHKQAGHPVVAWRDGKAVRIPPEAIRLRETTVDGKKRRGRS